MIRLVSTIFFVISLGLSTSCFAQPDPPPDPDGEPVPISGVEWLLLSGGLLGARKIYKNLKERK